MEIFFVFALFSVFVLGILSLIVLEYQNQRAKRWHQPFAQEIPPSQPGETSEVTPNPTVHPPITLPTPQTAHNIAPKRDAVLTNA